MPKVAKKQVAARAVVDREKKYSLAEACALVKKASFAKFDEAEVVPEKAIALPEPANASSNGKSPADIRRQRQTRFMEIGKSN